MKDYDGTFLGGAALLGAAAVLLIVAALTGRGDMTSATLVLVGFGSFAGGVVLLTQYRGEQVAPWVAGLAAAGGVVDLARVAADLGLQGNAHLVPRDGGVVQVVPVGTRRPRSPTTTTRSSTRPTAAASGSCPRAGLSTTGWSRRTASSCPTRSRGSAPRSARSAAPPSAIADRVEAVPEGDGLVVTLEGYRLYDGCRAVREASPKVCTMIGCPVCNLFAVMAAAGLGRTCVIEHVGADDRTRSVRLVLRILS